MPEKPTYEELERRVGELEAAESEWKKAKADLQESRNKYRTLFEAANDAILVASVETGIILDANQKAEQLTGRPRNEIIGMHQTALHPESQETYAETAFQKDAKQKNVVFHEDFLIQHADGRNIPVEISPSFIEVRGTPCVLGIFRDVTEKRERIESLQRYEAVIKAVTDPVSYVDRAYIYRIVGDAYLRYSGKPRDEIIGHPVWEVMGRDQFENLVRPHLDRCFNGETVCYDTWLTLPDGTLKYEEVHYYPVFNETGEIVIGAGVFGGDRTSQKEAEQALKKSEEHLRLITENLPAMVSHIDRDLNCLFANKAYQTYCGVNPEELIGKKIYEVLYKDAVNRAYPYIQKTLKGELVSMENHITREDGREIFFQINFVPHFKADEVAGYFVLGWDITDRKQAEAALQKSLAEKEVLLREIHHRVKNNMQTIVGLLRMHARRIDDAHLTEIFNDCRDRIGAMSLIHEALYQSQNLAKIDFEAYLKKLCRNLAQAHDAPRRRIDLTTSAADVSLNMDQGVAVGMIIAELISNAFKHAFPHDEGGTVSVHLDRPDGETVRLVVSDTGIGLPEDFDIQNPSSLGMRLVAGAVTRELGGTIDVENNNGARLIIRFKCQTE